jgi:hypothetical protein
VLFSLGADTMLGFAEGMKSLSDLPQRVMAGATVSSMQPAMATQSVSTSYYRTANVNMGGVNINNGLDMATLESMIYRIVNR